MNQFFRDRLLNNIKRAIGEAEIASTVSHRFLIGRIREIALENLIRPILSSEFSCGTGKVTDYRGNQSKEVDLVIYTKKLIAPILYSERFGMFPTDSCFATVEVKSQLTASEIKKAIDNSKSLKREHLTHISGVYDEYRQPKEHTYTEIFKSLFAFGSDLTEDGKPEFERYKENDPVWDSYPNLESICVVGKGYWLRATSSEPPKWLYCAPTQDYDEVFAFLRVLSDTIQLSLLKRGYPLIGPYLIADDKFLPV